jgi:hypothetical protein
MTNSITRLGAIKRYMEADGGRKITAAEISSLTEEDKTELGTACAAALNLELEAPRPGR